MSWNLSCFTEKNVIVIGDLMLDVYYNCAMERISPEAPIPILRTDESKKTINLGGSGNVANNFAKLGASVKLFGIGTGDNIKSLCDKNLVSLCMYDCGIHGVNTIEKVRYRVGHNQVARIDFEQCKSPYVKCIDATRSILDSVKKHMEYHCFDLIVLSDYGKGTLTAQMCEEAIRLGLDNGIPVYVDPKGTQWSKYDKATCITPNINEFRAMTMFDDEYENDVIKDRARSLIGDFAFESMLVTMGSEGMCYVDQRQFTKQTAMAEEVFDVSGAGDTVLSVFSLSRISGLDVRTSMELANIAAKIVIGKSGTCPITYAELLRGANENIT